MEPNPDHDYDDPANDNTFLRAYRDMTNYEAHPRCWLCQERRQPLAMFGTAWGWESIHEDHCPNHEDNKEPSVMHAVDHYGGPEHVEAEAIWTASQDDPS